MKKEENFLQPIQEDMDEGKDRMMDEGGGVVIQNTPFGEPILRNDLVDIEENE